MTEAGAIVGFLDLEIDLTSYPICDDFPLLSPFSFVDSKSSWLVAQDAIRNSLPLPQSFISHLHLFHSTASCRSVSRTSSLSSSLVDA